MTKIVQGILAHRYINNMYIVEHPGNIVNRDRLFGGIVGNYNGKITNYVDIIDYTLGDIYEIKPENGVVNGADQVARYLYNIISFDQKGKYFNGQSWKLGTTWPIPARVNAWPLGGTITYWLGQPGLIFYKLQPSENEQDQVQYSWRLLKNPEFKFLTQAEVALVLAVSLPAIIALVNTARSIDLSVSFSCAFII
ncbi:hypothetical protein SAMN02910289_00744 [Lachnospiraceae bacterium RM5]|nr:hypothetical protein SAMN02910289_00744 [Lachnospiraceae bacterium RM5]